MNRKDHFTFAKIEKKITLPLRKVRISLRSSAKESAIAGDCWRPMDIFPSLSTIYHSCRSSHGVDGFDGDDSDCFLSVSDYSSSVEDEEYKDVNDVGNTASDLQWRSVSSRGRFIRKITSWRKCGRLGGGSFGDVYEVITEDGSYFAVKEVPLSGQGCQGKQEIKLYRELEHENIVQCIGTDEDNKKCYIFLELMSKNSLSTLYRKRPLTESQVAAYTRQILEGLKYIHGKNVVHRDIKCANILVDASGSVKLADFGLAIATKIGAAKSCIGTLNYMAPEVANSGSDGIYGSAADIWSLGCTVLEMLTCKPPHFSVPRAQVLEKIRKGEPPRVPKFLSEDAQEFIHRCLRQNPKERPTAAVLLDHPFVRDPPTSGFA